MAYSVGNTISAGDLNLFNTKINNFFWGEGFTSNGYGQTPLFSNYNVSGQPITAAPWKQTVDTVENALKHQGTAYSIMYPPTKGQRIEARLNTNYDLAVANKFNAAAQGTSASVSVTSTQSFNQTQTITIIAYFGTGADAASHNKARYFFNAGGQFNISISHPTAPMSTIAANLGSIRFGAGNQKIAGVNYTGTTKVGGVMDAYSTVNTATSFYNMPPGYTVPDTTLAVQGAAGAGDAQIYVYAKYNGLGLLTFRIVSYAPSTNPTIAAGTVATGTVLPPSTTHISNSWGPVPAGTDITQTSVSTAQWYLFASSTILQVPAGKTTARIITIAGGGCGETATGATIKGGGGGGGGQIIDRTVAVQAGGFITCIVGAGGQGFQGYAGDGSNTATTHLDTQTSLGGTATNGSSPAYVGGGGATWGGPWGIYGGGSRYSYNSIIYAGGGGGGAGYQGFNAAQSGSIFQGEGGVGGIGVTVGPINGNYYNVAGGGQGGMNRKITTWTLADETGYKYGGGLGGVGTADGGNGVAGTGGGGGGGAQSTILDGTEPIVGGNGGSGFVAIYM